MLTKCFALQRYFGPISLVDILCERKGNVFVGQKTICIALLGLERGLSSSITPNPLPSLTRPMVVGFWDSGVIEYLRLFSTVVIS